MKNQSSIKKLRSQRRIQRLLKNNPNIFKTKTELKLSTTKTYWYQKTKQALKQINHRTKGRVTLLSHHYKGDHHRHWFKDTSCQHIFNISLNEIQKIGPIKTCPYCNQPVDMRCYGDINNIRHHIMELTFGNIDFHPDNELGASSNTYIFYSYQERCYFSTSYNRLLKAINECVPTDIMAQYKQAG